MKKADKKWLILGAAAVCLCAVIYINAKISRLEEKDMSNYQSTQENFETQKDVDTQKSFGTRAGIVTQKSEGILTDRQAPEQNPAGGGESVDDGHLDKIYPISTEMMDQKRVGDYIYFRYMIDKNESDEAYPALFRCKEGDMPKSTYESSQAAEKHGYAMAERVNRAACYHFEVVGDCIYYLDSTISFQDHGILYLLNPDGSTQILDDELYDFQIVDEQYIYYTYRHDTIGVGLEGHALQRMNLDGSDKMIAAWEVTFCESPGTADGTPHFNIKVEDGWADYGDFKMELGAPADGTEKLVCKEIGDNDYIYYVTNRLMKARRDGSESVELDGVCDYHYQIEKIEDDWIYYRKGGMPYKIRTDGTEKTAQ